MYFLKPLSEIIMPKQAKQVVRVTVKKSPTAKKVILKSAKKVDPKKVLAASKPKPPVATPPVAPAPRPTPPAKTQTELIWAEIENLPIQMFGLPDQTVRMHVTPVTVEPSKLYCTIRSSATLPSLESALGSKFIVELADRFVIVARAPQPLVPNKK
jgi:hypothetical protein